MKIAAIVTAGLVLAGCTTTFGLAPTSSYSGFDKARVVTISEHGNACAAMLCTGLGAEWTSALPDKALLSVKVFNGIVGITGASLSIDGRITRLEPSMTPTRFNSPGNAMRESQKSFVVPLSMVREIAASKSVWLRVFTTDGQTEDAVVDGARDSKAYNALGRFLAEVDKPT